MEAAERNLSLIFRKTPLLEVTPDAGTQTTAHGTVLGNKRCRNLFFFLPSVLFSSHDEDSGCCWRLCLPRIPCWGLSSSTSGYLCHDLPPSPPAVAVAGCYHTTRFGYDTTAANGLQAELEAAHLYPGAPGDKRLHAQKTRTSFHALLLSPRS